MLTRPKKGEFAPNYSDYINKTEGENVADLIANYSGLLNQFVNDLPEHKANYAYAPGKWTVKDVLQHLLDAERIFTYRALRFARKDSTMLPGFEEDMYAANANAAQRSLQSLKEEFVSVRKATDLFFASLRDEQLQQKGTANNYSTTVQALAFVVFGHLLHHKQILEERYLQ
ncbi:DinB family protein [Taibaiella soli]|uniref:DinB-like domain-containing protein n=1 Tax=Taibaiella soli TaxID=1649169 RepID=A0A2W2B1V4_9BACT|nr:DinB family protein [Taibaiella soli]PZF73998.1 hypothetical protein DN068_05235 [Taibaiella soli]